MILQVDPGGLGPCSVRLTALVLGGSWVIQGPEKLDFWGGGGVHEKQFLGGESPKKSGLDSLQI